MRNSSQGEGLILSLDVGSSSVTTGLFTADGCCIAQRSAPLTPRAPQPGWNELNLEQVWRAVIGTARDLIASHNAGQAVRGVGFSVASPTVVAVNSGGQPLSEGLTYSDSRAQPHLEEIHQRVGEDQHWRITGNRLTLSLCSAATMLYLIDEVGAHQTHAGLRVGHLNSFITNRLTGRWVIDWTNASYTGLVDAETPEKWSAEACEALGMPEETLPEIVAPWEPIGCLSSKATKELGLNPSTVVVAGAADTACSAYGVGCVEDGDVFESAGTSGVLTVCRSQPSRNRLFMNRSHVLPGRWLSHGAMSAAGATIRWLRDAIFSGATADDEQGGASGYEWLEAEAARSSPGAGGVVFLPYLLGERTPVWDPHARGAWVGMSITTQHHHLIRAVFESAGYGMRQMIEIEEEYRGSEISEVPLVGGGARSRFWASLKADITGKRYLRTEEAESATRGAAMLAAVGAGMHGDVWSASATVEKPAVEKIEPSADNASSDAYSQMYEAYTCLYPALQGTFGLLRSYP